ncbi:MAG: hypothetical protein AAGE96_09115 [Cyanobacteria bacterium P01_G01_bin.19]
MQKKIDAANAKLERLKIFQRGKRLSMRGTLPPKAGDGNKPKQYTLSPGLPATPEGLRLALAKAQKIEGDLVYGRFSWEADSNDLTVAKAIKEFEEHHWQKTDKTVNKANTFRYDYLNHFLYLPQDKLLTVQLLRKAIKSTQPDSRKRRGMAMAYSVLLNYFEIDNDLAAYKGNYQPTKKRIIPSLDEIDEYYSRFPSPQWRWAFGIIACYGIRPHELFYLDCSLMREFPPVLTVKDGTKTGSRLVYPLPDETRVVNWKLHDPILPNINTKNISNMRLGGKVGARFYDHKIPSPYHFRDAYAIQGAVRHFSPALVAQWMGHSLDVHYKKYIRHISKSQFTDAWLSRQQQ